MSIARDFPDQPPPDDREDMPSVKKFFDFQLEQRLHTNKLLHKRGWTFDTLEQLEDDALEELHNNQMLSYGNGEYQLAIHYKPMFANGRIIEVEDSLRLHQRRKQ